MMRFVILLLILGGFLGGYYVGHRPGSPDIFAWPQKAGQACNTARQLYAVATGEPNNILDRAVPDKIAIKLDGKDFVFPGRTSPGATPAARSK